jgi:hypothetical protein
MVSLEDMIRARSKGIEWILRQRNPDGSIGPYKEGIFYYRVPWALAVTGHTAEACMLLEWVRGNMFNAEGDFAGRYSREECAGYYTYPNANLIYGAHMLRQFDLSCRGMRFLLGFQDRDSGGFFNRKEETGPGGEEDIWCSSQAGLTCLLTGHLEQARKVAHFLETVYKLQPDKERSLYFVYHRGKGLVTDFPDEKATAYCIQADRPRQYYFQPGIAAAFLCRLYMATAERKHLDLAEKYIEFATGCTHLFSAPQVCKVGWGSALLYQVTKDSQYYDLAAKVADYFVEHQYPEGYWMNIAPYRTLQSIIEITAEFTVHLDTIIGALST